MKEKKYLNKIITLPKDVVKDLDEYAEADKRKTKPFIEKVVIDFCENKKKRDAKKQ